MRSEKLIDFFEKMKASGSIENYILNNYHEIIDEIVEYIFNESYFYLLADMAKKDFMDINEIDIKNVFEKLHNDLKLLIIESMFYKLLLITKQKGDN